MKSLEGRLCEQEDLLGRRQKGGRLKKVGGNRGGKPIEGWEKGEMEKVFFRKAVPMVCSVGGRQCAKTGGKYRLGKRGRFRKKEKIKETFLKRG